MKLYHNYLFLFGFIYYLICPILVGYGKYLDDFPGMHLFYDCFPDSSRIRDYYYLIFLLFIFFYLGSFSALLFRKSSNKAINYATSSRGGNIWMLFTIIIINQYVIYSNRQYLFSGYTTGYQVDFLGKIATMNCLYLFLFLYLKRLNANNLQKIASATLLIENSIVLIGSGSRMFVLIPVVSFLVYQLDTKRIAIRRLFVISSIFIVFFLVVGVVRQGSTITGIEPLVYIGVAEPVFTWIGAGSFMVSNPSIHLIDFPSNFIGTFINFIPTFLFPNKADYIVEVPYLYENPLGASSILVNMYGNFGLLATPVMFFIGGFLLTTIRYKRTLFFQIFYYCCCGVIPFVLFRDLQSTNKLLFTSCLAYPAIILFTRIRIKKSKKSSDKSCCLE